MKKKIIFILLMGLVFTSCKKDDENTFVKVTVKENSIAQSGVTVHMFSDHAGPNTVFFEPIFSDKKVITESNGVASFTLADVYDLEVIDSQTTLYFGVFDNNDIVLGSSAVTIEKGQTKSISINY